MIVDIDELTHELLSIRRLNPLGDMVRIEFAEGHLSLNGVTPDGSNCWARVKDLSRTAKTASAMLEAYRLVEELGR